MPQEVKKYLNIQEQVEKNKKDILDIQQGATVLADFGIRVIGQVNESSELPDPAEYEGEFGDAYAVGTEAPYDFYIFTRAFEGQDEPSWFNIGEFPIPGPQGETGPAGQDGSNGRGIVSIAKTNSSGLEDTYTITYTDNSTSSFVVKNGAAGQAAEITAATASVDSGTGTPSVEVSVGGTAQSRSFEFAFHNLRGVQGETGEPGSFIFGGQVTTASQLPSASNIDTKYLYLVGSSSPYDVYAIIEASGVKSWINLGPIAVKISDTKVGANSWASSGTLSAEVLNELVNTQTADFVRIGTFYFAKKSTGRYFCADRVSGEVHVYTLDIDLTTGEWAISDETMIDADSNQTFTGEKTVENVPISFKHTSAPGNAEYVLEEDAYGRLVISRIYNNSKVIMWIFDGYNLFPNSDNGQDIGSSSKSVKDFHIKGFLKDGTNQLKISELGAVKIFAPASTTLTEAEYTELTNGKAHMTVSSFLGFDWCFFLPPNRESDNSKYGLLISNYGLRGYFINKSTRVITLAGLEIGLWSLSCISSINGKQLPAFPTTNTNKQVPVIGVNGGNLGWEDKFNEEGTSIKSTGEAYGRVLVTDGADGTQWDKIYNDFIDSTGAGSGDVLTADGLGGSSWETPMKLYVHKFFLSNNNVAVSVLAFVNNDPNTYHLQNNAYDEDQIVKDIQTSLVCVNKGILGNPDKVVAARRVAGGTGIIISEMETYGVTTGSVNIHESTIQLSSSGYSNITEEYLGKDITDIS